MKIEVPYCLVVVLEHEKHKAKKDPFDCNIRVNVSNYVEVFNLRISRLVVLNALK